MTEILEMPSDVVIDILETSMFWDRLEGDMLERNKPEANK